MRVRNPLTFVHQVVYRPGINKTFPSKKEKIHRLSGLINQLDHLIETPGTSSQHNKTWKPIYEARKKAAYNFVKSIGLENFQSHRNSLLGKSSSNVRPPSNQSFKVMSLPILMFQIYAKQKKLNITKLSNRNYKNFDAQFTVRPRRSV
jgi:hypothetical protein